MKDTMKSEFSKNINVTKRYSVIIVACMMLFAVCLCASGEASFYNKISGNYLLLLPDNKTNGDLASVMNGTVYTDSSATVKCTDSGIAGTGRYISIGSKKYEIIVVGDYDGDGFILNMDLSKAKEVLSRAECSERENCIFDADRSGRVTSTDYILMKAHLLGVQKLCENYVKPSQSEAPSETSSEESVDPDWINQCAVSLGDDKITVTGRGATVSGKTVSITEGGEYTVSGKISDGMIQVNSTAKVKIRLSGANISNSKGPAILFANADKAYITVANGTVNYLSDGTSYSNGKGTVFSEVDLEIKGKGTLYVTANYRHGICCDDDMTIENGNIIVQKSVKDGIHAKKSLEVSGGSITIRNCSGDGIDCEGTSSGTKGTVTVTGGNITIESTAGDGINAIGNVALSGGTLSVSCTQDAIKTDAYAYLAGNVSFTANAGSDGINSVKGINVTGGTAKINAVEYTLKSDANISVSGGKLDLEGGMEKMYAVGNINVSSGTIQ